MSYKRNYFPGEVLMFSGGEYSDYRVDGVMRVLKKFNMLEEANLFFDQAPLSYGGERDADTEDWEIHADGGTFMTWLVKRGLAEQIELTEIHAYSYGDFKLKRESEYRKEHAKKVD